ncbi:universal stress protein [Halorubellus sp. PRR65]|uniref:universal stress protein n=1 Tax=Halorubellus sp. PRR65 TaxID=3098148 RepID=UPI002B262A48|nr:universal stress protein [Halorubellus sp. PRR65]
MFESILVAVDEPAESDVVVEHARALAARFDATLHVLHVVDVRRLDTVPESEQRREDAAAYVHDVAADVDAAPEDVEEVVRTDVPADAIVGYATEAAVDLVVVGTHGRTGLEHVRVGSVAEAVVRDATVPVVTVPLAEDARVAFPYDRVLVAADGSPEAMAAAEHAVGLAAACDAAVDVLSVVETAALGADVRSEILEAELREHATEVVDEVVALADEASVAASTTVTSGVPRVAIREHVTANDVDLVAMGTHGRSGVDRLLLGSVAERTLRTTDVPVLTVRRPTDAE